VAECLRVLKAGGHLLAFGGSRTYHRLACAIEDAGFQIRDQIMWVYGSGFPKSLNIGKAIDKAAGAEREGRQGVEFQGWQADTMDTRFWWVMISDILHLLRLRLNSGKGGEQHSNLLTNRL
jgi:hypothetical protein